MHKPILHPDVHIYLNKLKDFFEEHPDVYTSLFDSHDIDNVIDLIKDYAILNWAELGEPMLSQEQYIQVRSRLDGIYSNDKNFIYTHVEYPPICLN